MKFIDEVSFYVESGKGGKGCVGFRREKYVPRGGPDGGDGGKGGDVIFRVNSRLNTLADLYDKRKLSAKNGKQGEGQKMSGASGDDLVVEVPPGTIIREDKEILCDLEEGEVILLKGGKGGLGNWHFKNSVNQAPTYAQPGEEGEGKQVSLELKIIADVGLLGFPNAGKSTLISRVSAAKPKIADYPFTTLSPNLGVVKYADHDSFVIADIPGLIEGAHEGVGLGIQFLRHVERTRILLHLIDASGMSGRDPIEDFDKINHELKMYDENMLKEDPEHDSLSGRPQIVVLNKVDAARPEDIENLKISFVKKDVEVRTISAVTGEGLSSLVEVTGKKVFGE